MLKSCGVVVVVVAYSILVSAPVPFGTLLGLGLGVFWTNGLGTGLDN